MAERRRREQAEGPRGGGGPAQAGFGNGGRGEREERGGTRRIQSPREIMNRLSGGSGGAGGGRSSGGAQPHPLERFMPATGGGGASGGAFAPASGSFSRSHSGAARPSHGQHDDAASHGRGDAGGRREPTRL